MNMTPMQGPYNPFCSDCCAHIGTKELFRRFPKGSYVTLRSGGRYKFRVMERDGSNKLVKVNGFVQAVNPGLTGSEIWVHACQCLPALQWYEAEVV